MKRNIITLSRNVNQVRCRMVGTYKQADGVQETSDSDPRGTGTDTSCH